MESPSLRDLESRLVTRASILSPTENLSGLCSDLSRDKSERRINDFIPLKLTSIPPSSIEVTSTVMTAPRLTPSTASTN